MCPTSVFFNNFGASNEQNLLEDLVIESIRIFGIDLYYVKRDLQNYDNLYGADDVSKFTQAIQVEMYVRNYEQFEGDGNLMSKFGLEIRDQVTFTIATRVFENEINKVIGESVPKQGNLIYYPLDKKLFEIKYVERKVFHYPLGMLPVFDLHCELFEYSAENFDTGITEIDSIEGSLSINAFDYAVLTEEGLPMYTEDNNPIVRETYDIQTILPGTNNTDLSTNGAVIIDFTEINPFSEEFVK